MNMKYKHKLIAAAMMIFVVACVFTGCEKSKDSEPSSGPADLVVYGKIFTADNDKIVDAFAVKDSKFVYVGDEHGVAGYIEEGYTQIIDHRGKGVIIPGCTEAHAHFILGREKERLKIEASSFDEVKVKLADWLDAHQGTRQVLTFGLDEHFVLLHPDDINYAQELEELAPGIPVIMIANSFHSLLANVTAIKNAGLWKENPYLRGAGIELDDNNFPCGFMHDQALPYMIRHALVEEPLSESEIRICCEEAMAELNRRGYTNYMDAWLNFLEHDSEYKCLHNMELTACVTACYNIKSYDSDKYRDEVDRVKNLADTYQTSRFNPSYIKLFIDGVTESLTGWIFEDYLQTLKPGDPLRGNQVWTQEELNGITQYANGLGITIHSHAFGDAACNSMITAHINAGSKMRNSLGHARNITPDDMLRIAQDGNMGIAENMIWHCLESETVELLKDFLPEKYMKGYPMKSLADKGVRFGSSTDAPASETLEGNIVNIIHVAVNGEDPGNPDDVPFDTDELITVAQALRALTIDGAWTLGLENERGSIEVGKYADFVTLDKDVLELEKTDKKEIFNTKVESTWFEGKKVYGK